MEALWWAVMAGRCGGEDLTGAAYTSSHDKWGKGARRMEKMEKGLLATAPVFGLVHAVDSSNIN